MFLLQLIVSLLAGITWAGAPTIGTPIAQGTTLKRILASNTLRVGTTADYRPFSYIDARSPDPVGIDADLARDLARFLGVRLQWVRTTWQTLKQDYEAERFDIALSGISQTKEREKWGEFSRGYALAGKTPIARCENKGKYSSLDKIDAHGVRVIVNEGGTNQVFFQKHFHRAKVIVVRENARAFEQLTDKKADVMFTDSIEATVQSSLNRMLCLTMPSTKLEPAEIAALLPHDPAFKQRVDLWLKEIDGKGWLASTLMRHLNP